MRFYLRGHNYLGAAFLEELKGCPNIEYGGAYKNPEDMGTLFSKCDISWAINSEHYTPDTNDAWALCNRFYEGLLFQKPLIVQEGSAHADFVRLHDIGLVVDMRTPDLLAKAVLAITPSDVARWRANIAKISPSVYCLRSDAYADIITRLFG